MEKWLDVVGYEGIYQISDRGQMRTVPGKTTVRRLNGKDEIRHWKGRTLKQKTDRRGYKRVTLWKNKREKDFLVHRLVCTAFHPNPENKPEVNHIDGNPSNNRVDNLEWVTSQENLMHAFKHLLNKSPDPIVLADPITEEAKYFYSKAEASRFLGRSTAFISNVLKRGDKEIGGYEIFTK